MLHCTKCGKLGFVESQNLANHVTCCRGKKSHRNAFQQPSCPLVAAPTPSVSMNKWPQHNAQKRAVPSVNNEGSHSQRKMNHNKGLLDSQQVY